MTLAIVMPTESPSSEAIFGFCAFDREDLLDDKQASQPMRVFEEAHTTGRTLY